MRVLETALELGGEALHEPGFLAAERAGQAPGDRLGDDHRRQLAARKDVRPDRDRVRGEVDQHPLVEAFEPRGQEREALLPRELLDDGLRQLTALRREGDHATAGVAAVDGFDRRGHHVDPEHHPRPAAVRLVVNLAALQRRVVAVVEEAQVELASEHGRDRSLLREPGEGVRDESEDVELQGTGDPGYRRGAKPRATRIRPASRSTLSTHASTSGNAWPASSSRTSLATPGCTAETRPSLVPSSSSTFSPTS